MAAAIALAILAAASGTPVNIQSISVLPVVVRLKASETAASLTIINESDNDADVRFRAMLWTQSDTGDELIPTEQVAISPPQATIAPRAAQIVRLVMKNMPTSHEGSYRILIDQIPGPAAPGTVRIALRLSVPVFVAPKVRPAQEVNFQIERRGEQAWLVGHNNGAHHQEIREIALTETDGRSLRIAPGISPYILSGATHRWTILPQGPLPVGGSQLRLNAVAQSGAISQPVLVTVRP